LHRSFQTIYKGTLMVFRFEIFHNSSKSRARVGRIYTPHGVIDTPNFVAVGTNGTLKALDNRDVSEIGLQLMFCNTYHLLLQPGKEVIRNAGGLHTFINRKLPIITDSGGFQVFSLAYGSVANELKSRGTKQADGSVLKISEEGVLFRSYRDGSKLLLTPESSIEAQKDLGADIIIPLDELPPYHFPPDQP
jgi:queuine tRNA-ribosyltransferase